MEYFYITNDVEVAKYAEAAGVDRIWIDLEITGKPERQAGRDTVISKHTIEDIRKMREKLPKVKIMVRIDWQSKQSEQQIRLVLEQLRETDYIMLPYFKTAEEVKRFVKLVDNKAQVVLLLETVAAVENLDDILNVSGIKEIHIGLNDLHLDYKKNFMFELLIDGTVENVCAKIAKTNIPYGFGGVGKIGNDKDALPAEAILGEHYRLKSTRAILSRSFCNCDNASINEVKEIFNAEMPKIRKKEQEIQKWSEDEFENNRKIVERKVTEIVRKK